MLHRFEGDAGKRLRIESLLGQKMMVEGNHQLAEQMEERLRLRQLRPGDALIGQNASDSRRSGNLANETAGAACTSADGALAVHCVGPLQALPSAT